MEAVLTRGGSQLLLSGAKQQDGRQWAETATQEVFNEKYEEKLLCCADS